MNAALQALCNTTPLSQYFLQCLVLSSNQDKPSLSRNFQKLVQEMWQRNSPGFIVPSGILYGIRNVNTFRRVFFMLFLYFNALLVSINKPVFFYLIVRFTQCSEVTSNMIHKSF